MFNRSGTCMWLDKILLLYYNKDSLIVNITSLRIAKGMENKFLLCFQFHLIILCWKTKMGRSFPHTKQFTYYSREIGRADSALSHFDFYDSNFLILKIGQVLWYPTHWYSFRRRHRSTFRVQNRLLKRPWRKQARYAKCSVNEFDGPWNTVVVVVI